MLGEGLDAGVRGAGLLQGNAEGEGEPHNYERDRCGDPGFDADRDRRLRRGRAARAQAPGARRQRRGAIGRHPGDVRRGPGHAAAVRPRGVRRDGRRAHSTSTGCANGSPGIDLGIATGVLATFLGSDPIRRGWHARFRRRSGSDGSRTRGCCSPTGPRSPRRGATSAALRTTATPVLEDGRVDRLPDHRNKQWISNGGVADAYSILAKAPGGPTLVRRRTRSGRVHLRQARGQARHPGQQHRRRSRCRTSSSTSTG